MKKKVTGSLLMAMLTVGSTGMLVSCSEDYDDDIKNLQSQIDGLVTADELTSRINDLTSAIESAKSEVTAQVEAAMSVAQAAQEAANNAQNTADGAAEVAAAAQAKADELEANGASKEEVEAAKEAAAAAQAYAEQVKADADKALADLNKALEDAVKAATDAVTAAQATADEAKAAAEAAQEAAEKAFADAQKLIEEAKDEAAADALEAANKAAEALDAANKADAKAAEALTEALTAKSAAEAAAGDAAAAQKTADEAKEAAAAAVAAAANAQATAQSALDQIEELKTQIGNAATKAQLDEVKAALEQSIKDAQDAAEKAAKAAEDAAEAAQSTASEALTIAQGTAKSIETVQNSLNEQIAELSKLDARLATVEAWKESAQKDIEELKTAVDTIEKDLKSIIGEYSTMVTSVSLYTSDAFAPSTDIVFRQVEEHANKFPKSAETADKQFTFEDGYIRTYAADPIVVRVSPTTAVLTADNVSLINSQGVELSEFVKCTKVEPYTDLLTRASQGNGLWRLTFELKEGYDPESFYKAVTKNGKQGEDQVLFAVAIKNTELNGDDNRRVISTYDLTFDAQNNGVAANSFDLKNSEGKWVNIDDVRNRYETSENGTPSNNIPELSWLDDTKPGTEAILDGNDRNAANRTGVDNRSSKTPLAAAVGKAIDIRVAYYGETSYYKIKGFYVTLDKDYAVESAPSELNAWNSYSYVNVGTDRQKAHLFEGNTGSITINDMNGVSGDVIGFRLYAVNLDGTLLDPDGRSFYVAVGDVATTGAITAGKIVAADQYNCMSDFIEVDDNLFVKYDRLDWVPSDNNVIVGNKTLDSTVFEVLYYDKNKRQITVNDLYAHYDDVKYVRFLMRVATNFVDGGTYTQTLRLTKNIGGSDVLVKSITATMTKVMPTDFPGSFSIKTGQNYGDDYTIRPFMQPATGWSVTSPATKGQAKLVDIFNGIENNDRFTFSFANSAVDANGKTIANVVTSADNYVLTADRKFIEDKPVDLEVSYLYKNVSSKKKADGTWDSNHDYGVTYSAVKGHKLSALLSCWHNDMTEPKWRVGSNTNLKWTSEGATYTIPMSNISVSNTRDPETFGKNLNELMTSPKQYLKYVANSAQLMTDRGEKNLYFDVECTGDASNGFKFTFTQNTTDAAQAPYDDHNEELSFKVEDVYGHQETIKLDVKVQKP